MSLRSQKPDLCIANLYDAPLMSVNVTIRLKAIGDLRRREHIEIESEIRSSIVGGCSHSMKDEEKARDARLFSFTCPFFGFVSSEKRAECMCLSFREERRTCRIDRAFYWRAGLVLWKRHNFLHPTSDIAHTLTLLYARKNATCTTGEVSHTI